MTEAKTKERGIIFAADSVRAILAGRKTMTRRVVKHSRNILGHGRWIPPKEERGLWWYSHCHHPCSDHHIRCPYGVPGDKLWVREAFSLIPGDRDESERYPDEVIYRADRQGRFFDHFTHKPDGERPDPIPAEEAELFVSSFDRWRSPLHLPRWASRIALELTGVRVERLADTSEEDALAEGCECRSDLAWDDAILGGHADPYKAAVARGHRAHFRERWDAINGRRTGCAWEDNPWVFVLSFRKLEAPNA